MNFVGPKRETLRFGLHIVRHLYLITFHNHMLWPKSVPTQPIQPYVNTPYKRRKMTNCILCILHPWFGSLNFEIHVNRATNDTQFNDKVWSKRQLDVGFNKHDARPCHCHITCLCLFSLWNRVSLATCKGWQNGQIIKNNCVLYL